MTKFLLKTILKKAMKTKLFLLTIILFYSFNIYCQKHDFLFTTENDKIGEVNIKKSEFLKNAFV
ncbi:MAG: hypothetical protein B6I20_05820 [Bacteroidetes bacterium 4572_117]|nr:MAG: hypothetical protein B6I20_05820 [Bacteroidetes bacterium 4572_117]